MKKNDPTPNPNDTYKKQQAKLLKSIKDVVKRGKERGYMFLDTPITDSARIPASASELIIPKPVKNPSEITVARLQRIRDTLYANAVWQDPEYDVSNPDYLPGTQNFEHPTHSSGLFTGEEGQAIERSRKSKKGWESRERGSHSENDDFEPPFAPQPPSPEPVWYPIFDTVKSYLNRLEEVRGSGTQAAQENRERAGNYLTHFFEARIQEERANETDHEYASYLQDISDQLATYIDDMMVDSSGTRFATNINGVSTLLNRGEPLTAHEAEKFEDYVNGMWEFSE